MQTENCSLWGLLRLGNAPFSTSPCPAFIICGWRCTANHTAHRIAPHFPSKQIVNITKETIQTENCSLWRLPRLGDAPFGALPRPAFTIYGWRCTGNHTARPITPQFPSKLIVNITKETIQTENYSLWRLPRLGDALFGASPRPAFTICGWRYTGNHTARPITPQFPSKLIVNITKETIQTEKCSL